jgi:uncharacterized protein
MPTTISSSASTISPADVQPGAAAGAGIGPAIGAQTWRDLLFLHWALPPEAVQRLLPPSLSVHTFGGLAYVGIVPFAMARVRPRFLPPLPWLSWFLELNVRTYVLDRDGVPGVWFHSLDCNQPIAVELARRFFHLPYEHAIMRAERSGRGLRYACQRQGQQGPAWRYAWETSGPGQPAVPGSLEEFLVERYVLYSVSKAGTLYRGRVSHRPYRVHVPQLHEFGFGPADLAGYALSGPPVSVLAAEPVNVSIHPLRRLGA